MSARALRRYFAGVAIFVLIALSAFAALVYRPTPLTGFDGGDLARSVNGGPLALSSEPCRRAGDGWTCGVWDSATSGTIPYAVADPDWWGCWSAEPSRSLSRGSRRARTLQGCITLLDHE